MGAWRHVGTEDPKKAQRADAWGPPGKTTLRMRTPTLSSNQQGHAANASGIQAKKLVSHEWADLFTLIVL